MTGQCPSGLHSFRAYFPPATLSLFHRRVRNGERRILTSTARWGRWDWWGDLLMHSAWRPIAGRQQAMPLSQGGLRASW